MEKFRVSSMYIGLWPQSPTALAAESGSALLLTPGKRRDFCREGTIAGGGGDSTFIDRRRRRYEQTVCSDKRRAPAVNKCRIPAAAGYGAFPAKVAPFAGRQKKR